MNKHWVWRSTPRSIARHRLSVLAMVETALATAGYLILAIWFGWQWQSLIGAALAPVLLLRSNAAVKDGIDMYSKDVRNSPLSELVRPRGSPQPAVAELAPSPITVGLLSCGAACASGGLTYAVFEGSLDATSVQGRVLLSLSIPWLVSLNAVTFIQLVYRYPNVSGVALLQTSGALFAVAGASVGAFISGGLMLCAQVLVVDTVAAGLVLWSMTPLGLIRSPEKRTDETRWCRFMCWLRQLPECMAQILWSGFRAPILAGVKRARIVPLPEFVLIALLVAGIMRTPWMQAGRADIALAALAVLMITGLSASMIAKWTLTSRSKLPSRTFILEWVGQRGQLDIWSFPGGVVSHLTRLYYIRILCTFCNFRSGWAAVPDNWRDNIAVIDVCDPPELLPRIGRVSKYLTLGATLRVAKRGYFFGPTTLMFFASLLITYCMGLAYRISLKSTAWLWWPLIMMSHPAYLRMTREEQRVRTAATVRSDVSRAQLVISCAAIVWVLGQWPVVYLLHAIPGVSTLLMALPDAARPSFSLTTGLFLTANFLTLVIWMLAKKLAAYDDVMKGSDKMNNMGEEAAQIFFNRARLIERIRSVGVGLYLAWGYSLLLRIAQTT